MSGRRRSVAVRILFMRFRGARCGNHDVLRAAQLMPFRHMGQHEGTIATIIPRDVINIVEGRIATAVSRGIH